MLLKMIATGRQWGDKRDPQTSHIKIGGVDCVVTECDSWEGSTTADGQGQYYRAAFLEVAGKVRDDRFTGGDDA